MLSVTYTPFMLTVVNAECRYDECRGASSASYDLLYRHDFQCNDTQHNNAQHKDPQYKYTQHSDTQHKWVISDT
jgi:hypothetical protein